MGVDGFNDQYPVGPTGSGESTPLYDDPRFPGNRMRPRAVDAEIPLQAWARLCKDQGLGKKTNLAYDAEHVGPQPDPVDILEVRGYDIDATPLYITLASPLAIPRALADLEGESIQNATGEFSSAQIGDANYPGTSAPIAWPPIIAIVEWGVGGARARAYVDFMNGTAINLGPASFVRVHAAIPPDAINAPGNTGLYTLAAFVGPGFTRPGTAQRTIFIGDLTDGEESDIFVVPPFAKRVTIVGCDDSPGVPAVTVAYIRFWQDPVGSKNVGNYIVNGNQPSTFDVPNAGAYFSIVGTGTTMRYAAIYELAI